VPRCAAVSVGSRVGGLERGLVGFLWSTPTAVGGSRSGLSHDFGLRLLGRVRDVDPIAAHGARGRLAVQRCARCGAPTGAEPR
jgi:hypothetical protein